MAVTWPRSFGDWHADDAQAIPEQSGEEDEGRCGKNDPAQAAVPWPDDNRGFRLGEAKRLNGRDGTQTEAGERRSVYREDEEARRAIGQKYENAGDG
jgi:hypothetical protein